MFRLSTNPKTRQPVSPTDPSASMEDFAKESVAMDGAQAPSAPVQGTGAENPYLNQRTREIEAQRIAFQQKNPDFDMKAELQNPAFVRYVFQNNLSVEEAFFLVHREEILETAKAEALEEFSARRSRIPENGATKNRPAIAKKNPKDLSDKEIDAIIERAKNGEKISF